MKVIHHEIFGNDFEIESAGCGYFVACLLASLASDPFILVPW
jgi:hypothetical protein